jgi:DHA2 family multidrug resistance protein-like MFS transporter
MVRPMHPANRWLVLATVIAAFMPVVVDMTILHIAVPTLTLALGASATQVLWIIDVYPLVMAGLLVPMGTLGDRIGHRRVILIGLCVFTIASVAAAFSVSAEMLIGSRALLAVGGSMIMPAVLAVVRQAFEDEAKRAKALGIWTVVGSAGGAVGPLAGGFLLEHFWWGSVFLVNVPVMAVVLPLSHRFLPPDRPNGTIEWRIGQAVILLVGLVATVFAVKTAAKGEAALWLPILAFGLGAALLVWFGRVQPRSPAPMLDLSLFRNPLVVAGLLMAFISTGALAGFELVLAQELQFVLGLSPLDAGLFMLPLIAAAAVAGPVSGWLVRLVGLRAMASVGLIVAAAAFATISVIDLREQTGIVTSALVALGFSLGATLLGGSVAIMGGTPSQMAGAAGALESMGFELGGALGITFFGVLVSAIYRASLAFPDPALAGSSIGEAAVAARGLVPVQAEALMTAASSAFVEAHQVVLQGAAALMLVLAATVFLILKGRKIDASAHR